LPLDHLLPQVAHVEVDVVAVRSFERAPLLLLLDEGLGEPVAGTQLHGPEHGLRLRLAQVVVSEIAVAVLVEEPATLGARVPVASSMATTPWQRPSSTRSFVTKHSS